ncbi:L-2-hydroxyglutarate oxidase [Magnetococcales bacterium HHB-1]
MVSVKGDLRGKVDFLIIGGGVIGLSVARELKRRFGDQRIVVIEKEDHCGAHASGRNSGVLHAGFYYVADSLKARFTRLGNLALTRFCEERGVRINRCGKLVVARSEADFAGLDELQRRGEVNGIPLERISEEEAKEREPRVRTVDRALWSPTTASVDPLEVMEAMRQAAVEEGIEIHLSTPYRGRGSDGRIIVGKEWLSVGHVVNSAGLYADRVARDFGFSRDYRILPFKGLYLYEDSPNPVNTAIYPVPDLNFPFLGVHYTVTVEGRTKLGPTAIPCLWREQYELMERFNLRELFEVGGGLGALLFSSDRNFRGMALEEGRKYFRRFMVERAMGLATGIELDHCRYWAKPGIRAQLVNRRKGWLEMDFVIEGDHRSTHVLNAVSPAFTCSIPFAVHVVDQISAFHQ